MEEIETNPVDEAGTESSSSSETNSTTPNQDTYKNETDALAGAAQRVYEMLLPSWERQLPSLSKKGLMRVLLALVKVPLEDYAKKLSPLEKNVYSLSDRLLQAKVLLENIFLQEELLNNSKKEGEKDV